MKQNSKLCCSSSAIFFVQETDLLTRFHTASSTLYTFHAKKNQEHYRNMPSKLHTSKNQKTSLKFKQPSLKQQNLR